jgi:hypothetical protein
VGKGLPRQVAGHHAEAAHARAAPVEVREHEGLQEVRVGVRVNVRVRIRRRRRRRRRPRLPLTLRV